MFLFGVFIDIVEVLARQPTVRCGQVALVLSHSNGSEVRAGVMEHVLTATRSGRHQVAALLEAVDDSIALGTLTQRATDPRCGRVHVGDLEELRADLIRLDDAGPPGNSGHMHAALEHITFTARIRAGRALGEEIVHGAVVTHPHHEGVLGDSKILERPEDLPHIMVMLHKLVAGVRPLC